MFVLRGVQFNDFDCGLINSHLRYSLSAAIAVDAWQMNVF